MARNTLFIRSSEAAVSQVGQYEVYGTTGSETLFLDGASDVILDASFNRGGDTIRIAGTATDYSARLQNANLILTSDSGAYIFIPVGSVGSTLVFAGAEGPDTRHLIIANGAITLGGQVLVGTEPSALLSEDEVSTPTPTPVEGVTVRLTSDVDDLVGTSGDDRFLADGTNGSSPLGNPDKLAGGAGRDRLDVMQDAETAVSIRPTTTGIELLQITALQASDASAPLRIDAQNMLDVETIASNASTASLIVSSANTKTATGTIRATESLAVRMVGTEGSAGDRPASDLAVLFDRAYLIGSDALRNDQVAARIMLEDVGGGSNGGHLVVGAGDSNAAGIGIESFLVTVGGDVSHSSRLASLSSTNNALAAVIISSEQSSDGPTRPANLVIGHEATVSTAVSNLASLAIGSVPNMAGANAHDLTDARNSALIDAVFVDATSFAGDFELHATISENIAAKLFTGAPTNDPNLPGESVRYLFGGGNDVLNLNVSQAALSNDAAGPDVRFEASLGAGDDRLLVQAGNGQFALGSFNPAPSASWYGGHLLSGNLVLSTGAGRDFVWSYGASAAVIDSGAGADIVFSDNSGTDEGLANAGYAVWVFNARNLGIEDLTSETALSASQIANLEVEVRYLGFTTRAVVGDSMDSMNGVTVTDLDVNAAIIAAIDEDPVLSTLLRAEQVGARALTVLSQIDGAYVEDDLSISLVSAPLTEAQAAGAARQLDATQAASFAARYDSQFAEQNSVVLGGRNSQNLNSNRIDAGAGDDIIALSSNGSSVETLEISGVFGTDHVINFSARVETPASNETQVFFIDTVSDSQGSVTSVTYELFGQESRTLAIGDGASAAQIAEAIATDINARYPSLATASVESAGMGQNNLIITADGADGRGIDFGVTTIAFSGTDGGSAALPISAVLGDITDGHRGALGYDILDFGALLGGAPEYFFNGTQDDGDEVADLSAFIASGENGVVLIDSLYLSGDDDDASGLLDGGFGAPPTTAGRTPALEEARLQALVTALDDMAGPSSSENDSQSGVIITIAGEDSLASASGQGPSANVYQYANGEAAGDATVTYLGTLLLGDSLAEEKGGIGNWDAMTIENFTPLSASQLLDAYTAGLIA